MASATRTRPSRAAALASLALIAGCGGAESAPTPTDDPPLAKTAPSVGPGKSFRPPSLSHKAARGLPINGMRCENNTAQRFGAHLELFGHGKVVIVAPGIGIAPPRTREGAYVRDGRCEYPLRTTEPTGVIEIAPGPTRTLGDLFAIWGQPLTRTRLAGFEGEVRAHVAGRRWRGHPADIPLSRHAQIVLQVGRYVPPHSRYGFPPGL